MTRRWHRWSLVALFWVAEGLLYVGAYSKEGRPLADALRIALVGAGLWIPISIWSLWAAGRYPVRRGRVALGLAVHGAGAAAVVVGRALFMIAANPLVHWWDKVPPVTQVLMNSVRSNLLLYVLIAGAAHAVFYAERAGERERQATRLEAQLTEAKLAALRSQLQPHFLFNALGAIAELMHRDVDAADRMIVRLSRLLRQSLDPSNVREVQLDHELGCLEPYLELEKMRLGDRLSVTMDIDADARDAWLPALMLQPLVENAIRHGIAPRAAPGTVAIRAHREDEDLIVEIEDDGAGLSEAPPPGIGLSNTRARLVELYGESSALSLRRGVARGTVVRLSIPQPKEAA